LLGKLVANQLTAATRREWARGGGAPSRVDGKGVEHSRHRYVTKAPVLVDLVEREGRLTRMHEVRHQVMGARETHHPLIVAAAVRQRRVVRQGGACHVFLSSIEVDGVDAHTAVDLRTD